MNKFLIDQGEYFTNYVIGLSNGFYFFEFDQSRLGLYRKHFLPNEINTTSNRATDFRHTQ